jgi:preprotein translocase subunit SecG
MATANEKVDQSGERFKPKRRLRDPFFLIFFIATLLGFAALSGIVLHNYSKYNGLGGGVGNSSQGGTGTSVTLDRHTVYMLLFVAGLAFVLAALYLVVSIER